MKHAFDLKEFRDTIRSISGRYGSIKELIHKLPDQDTEQINFFRTIHTEWGTIYCKVVLLDLVDIEWGKTRALVDAEVGHLWERR